MPDVKWIKVSTGIFDTSRKIKQIETMPKGDTILIIWFKLMMLAGTINDGGAIYVTPDVPYTDKGLAEELRRPLAIVKEALSTFETYGMISREGGRIVLTSWNRYQNTERLGDIREYNRIAQQRSRAKKKASKEFDNVNDMSLTSQRCQTTDREKEKEIDNTICLSNAREESQENVKLTYLDGKLGGGVVMLSREQIDALLEQLSKDEFDRYVGIVRDEILKGHRYGKTHYQAILDMAMQDRRST